VKKFKHFSMLHLFSGILSYYSRFITSLPQNDCNRFKFKWLETYNYRQDNRINGFITMFGITSHSSIDADRKMDFFFFLVLLGVELRASCLLSWVTLPALFVLVIFEIGSCFMLRPDWTMIFLFVLPCVLRWQMHASHWLKWGLVNFLVWDDL
jgi:hypothetical protein